MEDYKYRCVDKSGHSVEGIMSASNESALDYQLKELGYWLIDSHLLKSDKAQEKVRVSRKELIEFCSAMSAMLSAGISLVDSFRTMTSESSNEGFTQVLEDISINVEAGSTVFDSMSKHPEVFPEQMRNLIKAGEYSGNLPSSFKDLQHHLTWVEKLTAEIKQVSIYPTIVFIGVSLFVLLLFTFVVPRFTDILVSLDVPIPVLTQVVMSIGQFTKVYWWLILSLPITLFVILRISLKRFPSFAFAFDQFKLKLPIFGEIAQMIELSRFAHNMAILLRSGIPILQTLQLCHGMISNRVVAQAIHQAELAVNEGKTLSSVLREHAVFPPMMLRMIVVGEQSGEFERALTHVSQRYDEEIPIRVKKVFSIIEPAIMFVLISLVGTVSMAIFLPLMSLMGGIS